MVLTKGKRFIKKVPPSGVAPVFKLTLPHSVVHAHMHHLIDAEFDIATSSSAPQTWHGRISPRRNKSRSEYTLQGWRLFAEALGVRAGDQVSFELVNRRRLVVRIIKTTDGRALEAESPLRTTPSPSAGASYEEMDHRSPQLEGLQHLPVDNDSPWSNFTSACAFAAAREDGQPGSFSMDADHSKSLLESAGKATALDGFDLWQGDLLPPPLPPPNHEAASQATGQHTSESLESASNFFMQLVDSDPDPVMELPSGAIDDAMGGLLSEEAIAHSEVGRSGSGAELDMQLFSLNTMLRRLQTEARDYHDRALKAEADVLSMKNALRSLRESADTHTRGMLRAGSGLEAAVRKLQAPELVSQSSSNSDAALSIRAEVMQYNDMLKACIWRLLNTSS